MMYERSTLKTWLRTALSGVVFFCLLSCKAGVQGGRVGSSFDGLDSITVLSPTTVKLSWAQDSIYSSYNIYLANQPKPIQSETFSTVQISSLTPATTYSFAVTGVLASNGVESQTLTNFVAATTLSNFTGLPASGLTVKSPTRIDLSWQINGTSAIYNIYSIAAGGTWNFTKPLGTVTGTGIYSATGLSPGTSYCFYVTATYLDNTSEPVTTPLTTVTANARCAVTGHDMINLPNITINSVVPGQYPWFVATGGDPTYQINIFDQSSGLQVASHVGNGATRSVVLMTPGSYNFYAVVKSASDQAQIPVALNTGGAATTSTTVAVRAPQSTGAQGPISPPLRSGGLGVQNLGQVVAEGDFNCDGLPDVAIAAPTATPYLSTTHQNAMGALVIYYSYAPPSTFTNGQVVSYLPQLWTGPTPSVTATYPNPQIVYFPTTTNYHLGTHLAVGNINNDCFYRPNSGTPIVNNCDTLYAAGYPTSNIFACQDLAISTAGNEVMVLFGDGNNGLITGSGAASFGINEQTCDATSSCRPLKITAPTGVTNFGKALAFGDYNNDGFDDLAISGDQTQAPNTFVTGVTYIDRGSQLGLVPLTNASNFKTLDYTALNGQLNSSMLANEKFGFALGTAYNSRQCVTGNPAGAVFRPGAPPQALGYDFTKCDDLIIGAPGRASGRGSIVSCKAVIPTTGADLQAITGWLCKEAFPVETDGTAILGYGQSILGVPNQNGYPLQNVFGPSAPSIAGALFVGAPLSTVQGFTTAGKVYGYYMTPNSLDYNSGGIQGILGASNVAGAHPIQAENQVACNATNDNLATGALKFCNNQALYNLPPQSGSQFGTTISTIQNVIDGTFNLPYVAISAPYRSVPASNGVGTVAGSGAVYVYRSDVSTLGFETPASGAQKQITAPQYTNTVTTCPTPAPAQGCTWYSGGVSPFGPSLVYPVNRAANSYFGAGGTVGGDMNGDGTGDLLSSSYADPMPIPGHGTVFITYGNNGALPGTVNNFATILQPNVSYELNYRFERAEVIGDVNGDGYDDVLTHIVGGTQNETVLFYGSASGLITSAPPSTTPTGLNPVLIINPADNGMGDTFHRVGSVNCDEYDDILLSGTNGLYVYYGSFSGLIYNVSSTPTISPVGSAPLWFGRLYATGGAVSLAVNTSFNTSGTGTLFGTVVQGGNDTSNQSVAYGDFNGDSCSDIVLGLNTATTLTNDVNPGALNYASTNQGRLLVVYGGSSGPQTDRSTGAFVLSQGGVGVDITAQPPCNPSTGICSQVQLIANPSGLGKTFGFALQGLAPNSAGVKNFQLLVGDPYFNSSAGAAYVYQASAAGLSATPYQTLVGKYASGRFGYNVASLGDVNGDNQAPDIAISAPNSGNGYVYIFYLGSVGTQIGYTGASSLAATDYWTNGTPLAVNATFTNGSPQPQILQSANLTASFLYGYGLAAAGDFNGDGFADLIVNVPLGDYSVDVTKSQTGYYILYFGSANGIQSVDTPTSTPSCYGGATPLCDPWIIYLPDSVPYENTYLSNSVQGKLNGDSLPDLVLGAFGRNHPSGSAFSVGIVYVVY